MLSTCHTGCMELIQTSDLAYLHQAPTLPTPVNPPGKARTQGTYLSPTTGTDNFLRPPPAKGIDRWHNPYTGAFLVPGDQRRGWSASDWQSKPESQVVCAGCLIRSYAEDVRHYQWVYLIIGAIVGLIVLACIVLMVYMPAPLVDGLAPLHVTLHSLVARS
jgi:hypothetical protein